MLKRLVLIFVIAFALNAVWEHFHSVLYVHYKSGPITDFILLRAALFDASFITALSYPFLRFEAFRGKVWLMALVALIFAIGLELWALNTGRWAYGAMPLVPIVGSGLTPTIQLALLGYISFALSQKILEK